MSRRKWIFMSVFLVIIVSLVLVLYNKNYSKEVLIDDYNENEIPSMISIMLETGLGTNTYKESSSKTYPTSTYEFNKGKSGCENGGTLSWNYSKSKLVLKTNTSDKCYAYFNVIPQDVNITVSNRPTSTTQKRIGAVKCNDDKALYNQYYNRIEISNIDEDHVNCTLNYSDGTAKTNLASYIMGLAGTTQGTGQVVNENGYRYEGKNPNNYIWFNNEYWRIIGVFDSASHGQSDKNLVKIIRENEIASVVADKSNKNNWSTASLNSLLNGAYYNATDGTSSGYCYTYLATATMNCNYTKKGIQADYRDMIVKATWYLGGHTDGNGTAANFYSYERGTTVYSGNPASASAYIGLLYPSDYAYSVLASSCARTTNIALYGSLTCAGASWLYGKGYQWSIMPASGNATSYYRFDSQSTITQALSQNAYGVRPVLYLDSTVYKISGDGSINSPYIIGM